MSQKLKQYPISDGWLHLRLSILPGIKVSQEEAIKYIFPRASTEEIEVAEFRHFKRVVYVVFRKKPAVTP